MHTDEPRASGSRRKLVTAALVVGTLLGSAGFAAAQTTNSTTPATTAPDASTPAPAVTDPASPHSNEDPAHEAGESAEREAAEDAGTAGWGHGHGHGSNEDPGHEATESPEREAAEDANGAQATTPAPTTVAPAGAQA